MGRFLPELLTDPYHAVRFVTAKAMNTLPEFSDLQYDSLAGPKRLQAAKRRALVSWSAARGAKGVVQRCTRAEFSRP